MIRALDIFGVSTPTEPPEQDLIQGNVSGGLEGPIRFPEQAAHENGNSTVDCKTLFIDRVCEPAEDVQGSYSHTMEQAFRGPYVENYGPVGGGYCLPDQTLGPNRNGFRGMAEESLPIRPPAPDWDNDYDNDGESVSGRRNNSSQIESPDKRI